MWKSQNKICAANYYLGFENSYFTKLILNSIWNILFSSLEKGQPKVH